MTTGKELILHLWKRKSERDLQKTIGASQFGSPCTRCVAYELLGRYYGKENSWWMAARIGTACHLDLQECVEEFLPESLAEERLYLGTLEDYGDISSTCDYYDPEEGLCADWKTTERSKLKFYKLAEATAPSQFELSATSEARFTLDKYKGQIMSYGRGLALAGHTVRNVSIAFICRDGKTDDDVWSIDIEYDPGYAEHVWERLVKIWDYLRGGGNPDELKSHPHCWTCNNK